MAIIREYKTAQVSSEIFKNGFSNEILENYFKNKLALYDLIQIPTIIEEKDETFLELKFNTVSCVQKIGFSCSPNGIGKTIYIAQNYITVNDEKKYEYEAFKIGKTGIFEIVVEDILLPDKEIGWTEDKLEIDIYSIKLPIKYLYDTDKISIIDFVFDYAYNVTN